MGFVIFHAFGFIHESFCIELDLDWLISECEYSFFYFFQSAMTVFAYNIRHQDFAWLLKEVVLLHENCDLSSSSSFGVLVNAYHFLIKFSMRK